MPLLFYVALPLVARIAFCYSFNNFGHPVSSPPCADSCWSHNIFSIKNIIIIRPLGLTIKTTPQYMLDGMFLNSFTNSKAGSEIKEKINYHN
jgi:hypothetical protein